MLTGRSVRQELSARLPRTFTLCAYALAMALLVAVPAGIVMALRAGGRLDRAIFSVLLTLWSVPMVVMGTLLLACTARGGHGVQWFPSGAPGSGGAIPVLWHLTLPALCLAIVASAPLARQVRAAVLEHLGAEHVQTALAKGLSRVSVMRRHVLRASLVPIVSVLAMLIPRLIAGSVLIETVYNIDGMGMLVWRSAVHRDLDIVLAVALLTAIVHMLAMLAADAMLMLLDPRIRIQSRRNGAAGA
jgi:peptide/nickel transport system permease protein